MPNTEALQQVIDDIETSWQTIEQDMPSDFAIIERESATHMRKEIHTLYEQGAYAEAFYMCETLVELLENIEIQYMYLLKKKDITDVDDILGEHLERVTSAPETILLEEHIEEMEQYKDRLHHLTVPHDTRMYRIIYHNLLWLECVCILIIILFIAGVFVVGWSVEETFWYMLVMCALTGGAVWSLRMTRHVWGVVLVFLIFLTLYWLVLGTR